MPHREHSAILLTFIKLPFVIKIFVLSIFEWPFYTGFTVPKSHNLVQILSAVFVCVALLNHFPVVMMIVVCSPFCLCTLVACVANNVDPDQTDPLEAV